MTRSRLRRRLDRLTDATPTTVEVVPTSARPPASDAAALAAEVAAAFGRMAAHYREAYGKSPDEARASALADQEHPEYLERQLNGPPDQVNWHDLDELSRRDAALALRRWEEVKRAARDEVTSGFRAARAVEGLDGGCWERARFLAARAELADAWRPRDGQEEALVDQLAQWQTLLWRCQEAMSAYAALAANSYMPFRPGGPQEPPRLSWAEAQERAASSAERLHRLYLRTLRALQDQRRARTPVVVRRAGQVNIARQQINIAGSHGH